MSCRALGVALGATLAALGWTQLAAAAGSRVVLVRDRTADAVVDRVRVRLAAELRAAGFEVDERVADGDDDARRIVEDPGGTGKTGSGGSDDGEPFATVLLRRTGARAATDVWVSDHVTHKTVVRRMGARGAGDGSDRALALRVVELMRASLVEGLVLPPGDDDVTPPPAGPASTATAQPPPPPPAPRPPPPDVAAWTREAMREPPPRARSMELALGAAGAFVGPDVGLAVAPVLRVAWKPAPAWSLGIVGVGPAFGARVVGTEGSATLRQELALAELALEPPTGGPVSGLVSLGAGAYHLDVTGDATAPFASGHDEAWAAILAAGGGLRVRIAGATSALFEVRELLALPRPVIIFASERVASTMSPGTLASLSLAVGL